jgi:hypothetical protein
MSNSSKIKTLIYACDKKQEIYQIRVVFQIDKKHSSYLKFERATQEYAQLSQLVYPVESYEKYKEEIGRYPLETDQMETIKKRITIKKLFNYTRLDSENYVINNLKCGNQFLQKQEDDFLFEDTLRLSPATTGIIKELEEIKKGKVDEDFKEETLYWLLYSLNKMWI